MSKSKLIVINYQSYYFSFFRYHFFLKLGFRRNALEDKGTEKSHGKRIFAANFFLKKVFAPFFSQKKSSFCPPVDGPGPVTRLPNKLWPLEAISISISVLFFVGAENRETHCSVPLLPEIIYRAFLFPSNSTQTHLSLANFLFVHLHEIRHKIWHPVYI